MLCQLAKTVAAFFPKVLTMAEARSLIGAWLLPQLGIHLGSGIVAAVIAATIGALLLLLILRLVYREGRW